MEGDYSRDTFDRFKHFSQVLMQQGRVQLDADWNEQGSILLHYLRTLAVDLIGQHGGPADDLGFEISAQTRPNPDLHIGPGHYYVDGILCENERATTKMRAFAELSGSEAEVTAASSRPIDTATIVGFPSDSPTSTVLPASSFTTAGSAISYYAQPDYPLDPKHNEDEKLPDAAFLVYLDVWVRHITYVEDDSIREVALGGPDTAARAKIVWQVKVKPLVALADLSKVEVGQITCDSSPLVEVMNNLRNLVQAPNRGRMAARAQVPEDTDDTNVCIVSPEAKYRGAENQLYRVEIHDEGKPWDGTDGAKTDAATFKWSRENGAVVFPIQSLGGQTVTLENLGRDDRFGLEVGDWVEVSDDDYVLLGKPEPLLQVEKIDRIEMRVTLSGPPKYGHDPSKHPLLRRWDQQPGDQAIGGLQLADGAALVVASGAWLNLEDGVQVRFAPGAKYRTGDYWLIPARTATGDIEWPGPANNRPALPPHGVEHHYAPLAVVYPEGGRGEYLVNDLRHSIAPAGSCCPKIKVLNPPTWTKPTSSAEVRIPFNAKVSGNNTRFKYNWSIQGGKILDSADNEPSIWVMPAAKSTSVIAVVVVEGLPGDCPNSAVGACVMVAKPS